MRLRIGMVCFIISGVLSAFRNCALRTQFPCILKLLTIPVSSEIAHPEYEYIKYFRTILLSLSKTTSNRYSSKKQRSNRLLPAQCWTVLTWSVCFVSDRAGNWFIGHKGSVRYRYSMLYHRADARIQDQPSGIWCAIGMHGHAGVCPVHRTVGASEG